MNVKGRAHPHRDPHYLTAFGFPTIHPNYPHSQKEKNFVRKQAGVPGQYCGSERNKILENDKLVVPKQHLAHSFVMYK